MVSPGGGIFDANRIFVAVHQILERFHLPNKKVKVVRISCTIKEPSVPGQISCAQVSEVTLPILKTWLASILLVCMFDHYVFLKQAHLFICYEQTFQGRTFSDKMPPVESLTSQSRRKSQRVTRPQKFLDYGPSKVKVSNCP